MKSIDQAKKDQYITIKEITGGREMRQKLLSLGIREQDKVFVLQDFSSGPLILMKDHIKIALGKGISKKILYEEAEHG